MAGHKSIPACFVCGIESVGRLVCESARLTVKSVFTAACRACGRVKKSVTPAAKDISLFLCRAALTPVRLVVTAGRTVCGAADRFKKRRAASGTGRAVTLGLQDIMLWFKKRGGLLNAVVNVLFPAVSIAALVVIVNNTLATDYGVEVEYDGEKIGVVSGEEVLGEAQLVVADRVRYYDTHGDCYVTAALSITPLTSDASVIDEAALAKEMENLISQKYDEIVPEEPQEAEPEEDPNVYGDKVKAFAVRVDGEFVGAVESFDKIDSALQNIIEPYDNGEYTEIGFDKDIEYDLEEYVDPGDIVPAEKIIGMLTGYESAPEYYEVQPGDNLWKIAESKGIEFSELSKAYATYNGQVVDNLDSGILRVGTLIKIDSEEPFLEVECKKEQTLRSYVPFETITIEDATLPEGQVVIDKEGEDGENRSRAIVTYREGVAVRKRTLETVTYKEPVAKIVRVGTMKPQINYNVPEFIEGAEGEYIWPVDGGYISSHQGDGRGHKGIDIAAPFGTPIYAAASGTVIDAGTGYNGGYGNCIMIQNDDGNVTVYAHQSELAAENGQYVEAGQLIGYVGSTGDSTGNHLHFEIRQEGKYINPENYVQQ
ncbi:MAG: peptidoglycan DD-metalloendopeptidase family protein [Oscillospiraceae bacterium]|nr:peptidoglycan DD-metalloendopeptidase family protein [Oscillospiraceae bacterium]